METITRQLYEINIQITEIRQHLAGTKEAIRKMKGRVR